MLIAGMAGMAAIGTALPAHAKDTAIATGEVRRIDVGQGLVALRHGEIKDMGLPAVTLVYHIAPALLKDIRPGDKVRFTATRQDGRYVVIVISKSMLP
jgi:Cu/Ag efflux protein CusF